MSRELQHRTNNAYDSLLLVEYGRVLSFWDWDEDTERDFTHPSDLEDWVDHCLTDKSEGNPDCDATDPEAYGELVRTGRYVDGRYEIEQL